MAFCPSCGTQADGRFCPKCGSAMPADAGMGAAPGATPGAATAGAYAAPPPAQAQASGMTDNMAGALAYLVGWITGVLFLVIDPYNKNRTVRFHAFQSIFFNVACIGIWIVAMIGAFVLAFIPVIGHIILLLMYPCLGLIFFITWLMLMYKAYNNEKLVLPIIGALAEKQAG